MGVKEKCSRLPCATLPALSSAKQAKVFISCCFSLGVRVKHTRSRSLHYMPCKQIVPHPLMLTIREGHPVCFKYVRKSAIEVLLLNKIRSLDVS